MQYHPNPSAFKTCEIKNLILEGQNISDLSVEKARNKSDRNYLEFTYKIGKFIGKGSRTTNAQLNKQSLLSGMKNKKRKEN